MTIKEVFDKATSENGALTLSEFESLAKAGGAKFTDLSEGAYVSKQKYLDELATKDTQITTLNETIQQRDTDLTTLQEQLKAAGNDSTKLDELNASLSALQTKYDADTQTLQGRLSEQALDFASRDLAGRQKFSSEAARRDFIGWVKAKNPQVEGGNIIGADDYLKMYSKENGDAFVKEQKQVDPQPQFAASATGDKKTSKMSLTELMQMKNENPDAVINFD